MAIPKEIQQKIRDLSREKKWDELVNFLRPLLEESKVTAQDIFHYAKTLTWRHPQDYAIAAIAINKIGVLVSELQDKTQAKLAPPFYKLAGERGSNWGYRNLAACFLYGTNSIQKSPEKALIYARQAVALDKGQTHSLILHECLKENQQDLEANTILIDFLRYLADNKKKITKKVSDKAIELCDAMIEGFFKQLDFEDDIEPLTEEFCRHYLARLETIFSINALPDEFEAIRQKASFLKGQLHEYLGEYQTAMQSYCVVTDKNPALFKKTIAASANLLKQQARILLAIESNEAEESNNESEKSRGKTESSNNESEKTASRSEESNSETEKSDDQSEESDSEPSSDIIQDEYFLLPQNVRLPSDFRRFWIKEATWFYSVNEEGLREEAKTRKSQLKQLIDARKLKLTLELEAVSTALVLNKYNEQLILKKEELTRELENLTQEKANLLKEFSARVELYLPENRRSIRMHSAEQRFFDFSRSRKKKKLLTLTHQIIDQRVRDSNTHPEPIDLTGTSTRLLITAEKLCQEALTPCNKHKGKYAHLTLPTARKAPWERNGYSGTNDYAPKESYKIEHTEVTSEHRTNPKKQRLGDSFLPKLDSYSAMRSTLVNITGGGIGAEESKKIAKLMIRYGRNQQSITAAELQELYSDTEPLPNENEEIARYTDLFNRICFLVMAKEQVQWLSAIDPQYHLGMTVAQARCLIMMEAGFITLEEAFHNGALFGVYTGSELADYAERLARPCDAINALYLVYLQSKHPADYMSFFKKNLCAKDREKPIQTTLVLTREQAHLDLKYVYGGQSDTDDEEYTSDLDIDHDLEKSIGKCAI